MAGLAVRVGVALAVTRLGVGAAAAANPLVESLDRPCLLTGPLKVQIEVIERVERAGGEIFALDHGRLTNGTAAQRLSANMLGSVHQYCSEIISEKVRPAHARAVANGVLPNSRIPPGLVRSADGVLAPDDKAPVVVEAFERRDRGASIPEVQAFLAANGIERSISGVQSMLRSRMYLGEIKFGKLENSHAHKPILDRRLFERVQRRTGIRGRQAKSQRLLARLGVLRCGKCGSRMVINTYSASYKCGNASATGCARRAAVKAHRVEALVMTEVRAYLSKADVRGGASHRQQIREADETIARADAALNDTIGQLGELGLLGKPASKVALQKLTKALDDAHEARARLGDRGDSNAVNPNDIDRLRDPAKRLEAWRRLIIDTVESVTVAPAASRQWDASRIVTKFLL